MGAQELIIIIIIIAMLLVPLALVIWTVVDVARRSEEAFAGVTGTRALWLVLPIVLTFAGLGWAAALVYLVAIRPKLGPAATASSSPAPPTT